MTQSSASKPARTPIKSPSTNTLPDMSAIVASPAPAPVTPQRVPSNQSLHHDYEDLNTLPDPRSRAMSPAIGSGAATPVHQPDLSDEVATLSNKLVNAINHQTNLDNNLSTTRLELESSREQIRELEAKVARQQELIAGDVWVRRKTVEAEKKALLARVTEEKKLRKEADQEKKKMEQDLESLTAALFEEANKMVISAKEDARKEQEALQRRNDQLKAQLSDNEALLRSQQEQLAQLKHVMEQMTAERDDQTNGTAPSSPGLSKFDARDEEGSNADRASQSGLAETASPSYPTSFSHLIQPVLRTDLAAYDDFMTLIRTSKRNSSYRSSSGSLTGLAMGLGIGSAASSNPPPSNTSTTSLSTVGTPASLTASPQTPNTPASSVTASSGQSVSTGPLKDTKFYKRALAEDIEPTLRLDTAPGLSWLARRSVLSSMTDGSLVVEPVSTNTPLAHIINPQHYSCSLCGENRKEERYLRTHRFRTSEADSAQRYPLCKYCLGRVRSTCGFLGFLRIVKDGHWRAEDDDAEKAAWEESVRLREQMFWNRVGGGVVPTNSHLHTNAVPSVVGDKSPRNSHESQPVVDRDGKVAHANPDEEPEMADSDAGEVSATPDSSVAADNNEPAGETAVEDKGQHPEAPAQTEQQDKRASAQSLGADAAQTLDRRDEPKRLSITIPGAFED